MKRNYLKQLFLILTWLIFITASAFSSGKKNNNINKEPNTENYSGDHTMTKVNIRIRVNSKTFRATLLGNDASKSFKEMLPLTINMTELNDNEKYFDLPKSLPADPSNPATIQNGDLMLYGSKTLVLFCKTFSTAYSYTKLGTVNDVTGFASALGAG